MELATKIADEVAKVEVKRLAYDEFAETIKAPAPPCYKEKFFKLSRWENRPEHVVVLWAEPFAVFVDIDEGDPGLGVTLPMPPRLYLVWHDLEQDEMSMTPTAWEVVGALKPEWHKVLGDALWVFRRERQAERFGVTKEDPRLLAKIQDLPSKSFTEAN